MAAAATEAAALAAVLAGVMEAAFEVTAAAAENVMTMEGWRR